MNCALGISVHTGWGACVVVGRSLLHPDIVANETIEIVGNPERFFFHAAAGMKPAAAEEWIEHIREKALVNAKQRLSALTAKVSVCNRGERG